MSYELTGVSRTTWNASPLPEPCTAASSRTAGWTGHPSDVTLVTPGPSDVKLVTPGRCERNSTATSFGGRPSAGSGSYIVLGPTPFGMRPNVVASKLLPPRLIVIFAARPHVFARKTA